MRLVKNFLSALILLTCFLIPQIVSAEKTDWSDNSYDFKSVKKVMVMNINSNVDFGGTSDVMRQKIFSSYFDNAKKLKCTVVTENDGADDTADLRIECKITTWEDSSYIVPERTVWETKTMYRSSVDFDGDIYEEKYYVTVPVTYPPYRVDVSDLVVSFEVYDTKTGKMVFGREDNRSRDDEDAQKDMFGRMCNSFFSDFGKKLR